MVERCSHRNVIVLETQYCHVEWTFEDGKSIGGLFDPQEAILEPGDFTNHIEVRCLDCDFVKTYRRGRLPKWVHALDPDRFV